MIDTFRRIKRNKAQIRSCFKITHLTMNSYPKYIKNSQLKLNVRKWTKRLKKIGQRYKYTFYQRQWMDNKRTKRYSISLVINGKHTKSLRYHCILIIIFLIDINKWWQDCWTTRTLKIQWWKCEMVSFFWKFANIFIKLKV